MSTTTRVLIVDDEAPARRRLRRMLERLGDVDIVGEASDGVEARELLQTTRPDVAFLDIDMPGLDGLSVAAERAESSPQTAIIFVTAHPKHAVEAFDLQATDYLLKPVTAERLDKALSRIRQRTSAAVEHSPRVSARHGTTIFVFDARQVERLSAADKYVILRHDGREYLVERSLAELEEQLAGYEFFRAHRKELINLGHLERVRTENGITQAEMKSGQTVPVSRRQASLLRRKLGL